MLIAGGSNMDNDVAVEIALLALPCSRHLVLIWEMQVDEEEFEESRSLTTTGA
jgi:hypothetical protein